MKGRETTNGQPRPGGARLLLVLDVKLGVCADVDEAAQRLYRMLHAEAGMGAFSGDGPDEVEHWCAHVGEVQRSDAAFDTALSSAGLVSGRGPGHRFGRPLLRHIPEGA